MTARRWDVQLTERAKGDFGKTMRDSRRNFGARQQILYRDILFDALDSLAKGPRVAGSVDRGDLRPGLRTLHCARRGRRASHLIVYIVENDTIQVLRILHEKMDIVRHLPSNDHVPPPKA